MFDARRLLDALVGGGGSTAQTQRGPGGIADVIGTVLSQLGQGARNADQATGGAAGRVLGQATSGLGDMARTANQATGGVGARVDQSVSQLTGGQSAGDLAQTAKDFMTKNPGLAEAAALSAAGILFGTRQGRSIAGQAAGLGGLALVAGLAYKAFQNHQAGQPLLGPSGTAQGGSSARGPGVGQGANMPNPAAFDPARATDDDAQLYLRAMVAAATADGRVDENERARIHEGLSRAGVDEAATRWLQTEMTAPATIDELANPVTTPEQAAKVYAAARIAIEPDTMQEREFLRQLAESLDLDPGLRAQIDAAASGIKVG